MGRGRPYGSSDRLEDGLLWRVGLDDEALRQQVFDLVTGVSRVLKDRPCVLAEKWWGRRRAGGSPLHVDRGRHRPKSTGDRMLELGHHANCFGLLGLENVAECVDRGVEQAGLFEQDLPFTRGFQDHACADDLAELVPPFHPFYVGAEALGFPDLWDTDQLAERLPAVFVPNA